MKLWEQLQLDVYQGGSSAAPSWGSALSTSGLGFKSIRNFWSEMTFLKNIKVGKIHEKVLKDTYRTRQTLILSLILLIRLKEKSESNEF